MQTLRYVAESLDKLAAAVDGADAAPSPDARAGLAKLQPVEAAALAAWSHWQAGELAAINRQLVAAGAEAIPVKAD